jgi:N-ethylmaleimide reductase
MTTALRPQPLLRPLEIGGLRLPNRVVMAPTTRARALGADLAPTDWHAAHYAQRADAGLIITEGSWISEEAIGFVNVPGCWSDAQVAGWGRVTGLVHALGGRIVLQLWHAGAVSHPDHLHGARPLGPSAVDPEQTSFTPTGRKPTVVPRPMTGADLARTIADYRAAAARARSAGFDGVELPALPMSLLGQFLDPGLNRRGDAYGGSAQGRRRLLLEVVAAVAEVRDLCVGVRLGPWLTPGEEYRQDCVELAAELAHHPVDYLHLRGPEGTGTPDFTAFARYRTRFPGPLIANLGFDGASGNAILAAGTADAVSYATHFIANPDLVTRFALGRPLAQADPATFYQGGRTGYLDYPTASYT